MASRRAVTSPSALILIRAHLHGDDLGLFVTEEGAKVSDCFVVVICFLESNEIQKFMNVVTHLHV